MSAFKDAGHHWWMQCPSCGMAWWLGAAPAEGRDAEEECKRCKEEPAALARARAEALEEAKEAVGTALRDLLVVHTTPSPRRSGIMDMHAGAAVGLHMLTGTTPPASIPVERVREEARRLITEHLTSEAEVRAVATLADACGANVDDLVPHDWVGVPLDAATGAPRPQGVDLRALSACSHGRVWPDQCPQCLGWAP